MVELLKDKPLPKTAAEKYGDAIEKMQVDTDSIIIPEEDRMSLRIFVYRKYKQTRTFTIRKVDGEFRVYRTK